MRISLIIPVYNEAGAIDRCLANLEALEGEAEVLFADGGSTDGTLEKLAGRRVIRCPKGRARQMNEAARQAGGDVLWFSHCDSLLPRDGLGQIAAAVGRGPGSGASTSASTTAGPSWAATLSSPTFGPGCGASPSGIRGCS